MSDSEPSKTTVTIQLRKWLCVSRGSREPADWTVWFSDYTSTKPPFAEAVVGKMSVEVACNDE